jgi:hypothetical protein
MADTGAGECPLLGSPGERRLSAVEVGKANGPGRPEAEIADVDFDVARLPFGTCALDARAAP